MSLEEREKRLSSSSWLERKDEVVATMASVEIGQQQRKGGEACEMNKMGC